MRIKRLFTKDRPQTLLDVTPFADIVFLLLIFFMLSSTFVVEPGIKLRLPEAETAEIDPGDKILISVDQKGEITINKQKITIDALEEEIRMLLLEKQKAVVVRADKAVNYGVVIEVLDRARLAGAKKLAVATEKK